MNKFASSRTTTGVIFNHRTKEKTGESRQTRQTKKRLLKSCKLSRFSVNASPTRSCLQWLVYHPLRLLFKSSRKKRGAQPLLISTTVFFNALMQCSKQRGCH